VSTRFATFSAYFHDSNPIQPARRYPASYRVENTFDAMPDSSAIPVRRADDARQAKAKIKPKADPAVLPSIIPEGPRKLIRPRLQGAAASARHLDRVHSISPLQSNHTPWNSGDARGQSSHAEAFYFRKQIQSQTLMIFVLEGGEQIEGHIEWYDRDAIKVRQGGLRTLIYKTGIKYLYKAVDGMRV
jgi:sRNA-binding regulator protein Hfq